MFLSGVKYRCYSLMSTSHLMQFNNNVQPTLTMLEPHFLMEPHTSWYYMQRNPENHAITQVSHGSSFTWQKQAAFYFVY